MKRLSTINIIATRLMISLRCSHEKSSEFRRDDHDKFDEAGQQGEAECKSSDERQSVQPESAV